VKELAISNKVSLAFINPQSQGYATLYGTAEVITNIKLKRQYWRAYWSDIFPGGPDNPDYILIKVTPYKIELMDFAQQALPQPYGLKPAVLIRDSEVWKLVPGEE
jgi:general stress protein 26